MALFLSVAGFATAQEKKFEWTAPAIGKGLFSDELGMLDRERDDYAGSLAAEAANRVLKGKGSVASLADARRLLGLAMQLAPRNRKVLVLNFQLGRGMLPEGKAEGYDPEVLARLLFTRAEALKKQGGAQNQLLARAFIEISAELDPKNEDAVYASELQRLDHGSVDWSAFTDAKGAKPEPGGKEVP